MHYPDCAYCGYKFDKSDLKHIGNGQLSCPSCNAGVKNTT